MSTYTQPTAKPTAKVAAVGYAAIVTTLVPLVVFILAAFNVTVDGTDLNTQILAVISAIVTIYQAITAVIHFAAGYFKKSTK